MLHLEVDILHFARGQFLKTILAVSLLAGLYLCICPFQLLSVQLQQHHGTASLKIICNTMPHRPK